MRVKRGFASRRRHKRMLKLAKGFKGRRKSCYSLAKMAVQKGQQFAYRDRKAKKRTFRALWIARINAGCRPHGISYSSFIKGLGLSGIELDRKVLAYMASHDSASFSSVVEQAKAAIDSEAKRDSGSLATSVAA
jgi:large subunit ribosomal protein L20